MDEQLNEQKLQEEIEVNGKKMLKEEFETMKNSLAKDMKLVEVAPGKYKTRIFG